MRDCINTVPSEDQWQNQLPPSEEMWVWHDLDNVFQNYSLLSLQVLTPDNS